MSMRKSVSLTHEPQLSPSAFSDTLQDWRHINHHLFIQQCKALCPSTPLFNIKCTSAKRQYLLQDINAKQPGPGDDAALSCTVPSKDEIGWSEQLGLSQATFGFLVAGGGGGEKREAGLRIHHKSSNMLKVSFLVLRCSFSLPIK